MALKSQGVVCFAEREHNQALFVLVSEWLGSPIAELDPTTARSELLRRFLRCYGPATKAHFADWLGVQVGDIEPWWSLLTAELTRIGEGSKRWLLAEDLPKLGSVPTPRGVRLLPPHDPYLQLRDRETILDKSRHKAVWGTIGNPGAILVDGQLIGTWRARKSGNHLNIKMMTFQALNSQEKAHLGTEAEHVAALRGTKLQQLSIEQS